MSFLPVQFFLKLDLISLLHHVKAQQLIMSVVKGVAGGSVFLDFSSNSLGQIVIYIKDNTSS